MGRPAKSTKAKTGKIGKDNTEIRQKVEETIQGKGDKIEPSNILNDRQVEIFNSIVNELKASKILGNLDVYVLNQTAICIERLEKIDLMMNNSFDFFENKDLKSAKDMYMKQFFRCCNELCLSPQSRAKLSIVAIPPGGEKKKTLADILGDDEDD